MLSDFLTSFSPHFFSQFDFLEIKKFACLSNLGLIGVADKFWWRCYTEIMHNFSLRKTLQENQTTHTIFDTLYFGLQTHIGNTISAKQLCWWLIVALSHILLALGNTFIHYSLRHKIICHILCLDEKLITIHFLISSTKVNIREL